MFCSCISIGGVLIKERANDKLRRSTQNNNNKAKTNIQKQLTKIKVQLMTVTFFLLSFDNSKIY